jgi:hypothetical protein
LSIKFLVPEADGFASRLATYINLVKDGKAWYKGSKSGLLIKQTMGKNMISKVPNDSASRLALQDPEKYTFYSFRWTGSTSAADGGAPTEQMIDIFSWKNGSMCTENESSSKLALGGLAKSKESSGSKEVMLKQPHLEEEKPALDEDHAMYSKTGIPFSVGSSSMADQKAMSEASIKQAISSQFLLLQMAMST